MILERNFNKLINNKGDTNQSQKKQHLKSHIFVLTYFLLIFKLQIIKVFPVFDKVCLIVMLMLILI